MTLKFFEKFDHRFSHVFIFLNVFPESHGFIAMPVTSCINDTWANLSLSNKWRETKLLDPMTDTPTKSWLSANILSNINTCTNGWSIFSEYLWIVVLKLLELINSILTTKSINLLSFCTVLEPLWCWHFLNNCPCVVN